LCAAFLADEIGAGGERLAQLDGRRADRLESACIIGLGGLESVPSRAIRHSRWTGAGVLGSALDPAQRAVARKRPAPGNRRKCVAG
jgi:hypothetical protein